MKRDSVSRQVIGAAIDVHRRLGPGLLESAYEACLCYELSRRRLRFLRQHPLPIAYGNLKLDCGYRIDLLVEDQVVVEIKSIQSLAPIHEAQLMTYLKLGRWKLGLLINFNVELLTNGIRRRVL